MSAAPVPQRSPASPAEPDGGRAAAPARGGAGPTGGWPAAAAWYAPVVAAGAAMTVAGVWGLARHGSMGNDEVATRWAALLGLRQLAHLLSRVDVVHGLYYLLMHGWVVIGSSPTVLRIPSVIAAVAAVVLAVILTRRLTGSGWAGLFAGLVMAVTPSVTFYAQTARSYALVLACVLGATLALVHALHAEATGATAGRRWLAYGALVTLGGYLNEMSLLALAAHAVTVVLARGGRRSARHWLIAAAAGAAAVIPLAVLSARQGGAVSWIHRPGLTDLRVLFHDYFGGTIAAGAVVAACALAALLPSREGRWWSSGGVSLPSVAAPLLAVPAALLLAESLVTHPLYVDRYVLYGEAGAALLAGAGMARIGRWLADAIRWRWLAGVAGVALCVAALLLQLGPQHHIRSPRSRMFDFGGPARYVRAHARPGDGVLFLNTFFRKDRLGYPGDFRNTADFAMAESPARVGDFRGLDKPFGVTGPLMLGYQRIWAIGRPLAAWPPGSLYGQEAALLQARFVLVAEQHYRGIVVTLWRRR